MANNRAQYDVRLAFSADVAQARQQLQQLQIELNKLSTFKDVKLSENLTKEIGQAAVKAADLKLMLEKATDINTGKLNLTSFSNQLTKNGENLATYRKALSALGPQGEEAFLQLTQSIITADAALSTGSKKLNDFKKTLANTVKWQISSSMMHSFIGGIETAYNYAKDLDRSLTDIKIVTESNSKSMADFASKANKAAQALSTTTNDYAKASLIYYQQGLNDKEVEARTAVTIKMANAAGESASKVSDQLTAVWNNFYDGSKSLEYYADVMTKLGAYTASSTDEISQGVQKFASVANTIGLSYEYATSALATLTAKTRESADTVGNSLKTLFARIQGLTLGETLEDGTDLNKYSKALMKAGIDIKDQNGELKEMNVILDEMMDKWDSLGRAEQVALAQTVGGVRQYTQLINLMKNKDYFKELVGVAENSEGTLQTQADIYAESWEGARKRVQAAAEGIYDSLIDEDFFKDVDNVTSVILNGIDATIEGLGGVKGVLANIGALITNVYKKELTSGLNTVGNMFMNLTSKGRAAIEARRQEALEEQKQIYTGGIDASMLESWEKLSYQDDARYEKYTKMAEVEQQILNISKQLTEEEQKQAGAYLDIINAASDRRILTAQRVDQVRSTFQTNASALTHALSGLGAGSGDIQSIIRKNNNYLNASSIAYASNIIPGVNEKTEFTSQIQTSKIQDIKNLQKMINDLENFNDFDFVRFNEDSFIGIKTSLEELIEKLKNGTATAKEFNQVLKDTGEFTMTVAFGKSAVVDRKTGKITEQAIPGAKQEVEDEMSGVVEVYEGAESQARRLSQTTQDLSVVMQQHAKTAKEVIVGNEGATRATENLGNAQITAADKIVATSTAMMNLGTAFNSIQGIANIWSNDNLSGWEKILGSLTSLGLIIPNIISLSKALETISKKITKAKFEEAAAHTVNGQAMQAEGQQANVAKQATSKLGAALGGVGATASLISIGLTVLMALISGFIAHIEKMKKNRAEAAEQARESYEQIKQEVEENQKLINSYNELLETYKKTGDGKTELVEASKNLVDVFDIENGSLLILQGNYDELAKKIREAQQAKQELTLAEAKEAYKATAKTTKDTLGSTIGNYNDIVHTEETASGTHSAIQVAHIGGGDYGIMQQYLDAVEGSTNWSVQRFDNATDAFDPANIVEFYDTVLENIQWFSNWAKKSEADGGLGWTEDQVDKYLKETRSNLAKMKESVDTYRDVINNVNTSVLDTVMAGYDSSKVKNLAQYAQQRQKFSDQSSELESGYSNDPEKIISSYLGSNELTSNFEILYSGLETWYNKFANNLKISLNDIITSGLSDTELQALINIDPTFTDGSLQALKSKLQKYFDTNPVDISTAILKGKKALKEDMSSTNAWKDFWEATGDITWGENGIISKDSFQAMAYGQQQEYLSKLYTQNNAQFTPQQIIERAQKRSEEIAQERANVEAYTKEDYERDHPVSEEDKTNYEAYTAFEENFNDLLNAYAEKFGEKTVYNKDGTIKSYGADHYRDMVNQSWGNPTQMATLINILINKTGWQGTLDYTDEAVIAGKAVANNGYSDYEAYQTDKLKELNDQQAANTADMRKALIDLNESMSSTISTMSATKYAIGDIISVDQYTALKQAGINMDDYFIQMEDGSYKLISAAKQFNQAVSNAGIENAYNAVDLALSNIFTSGKMSTDTMRATGAVRANYYVNASDADLSSISDADKEKYIAAMGLNPNDFDNLNDGLREAAEKFIQMINTADYEIKIGVYNSKSVTDLINNAQKAGWNNTDEDYINALLNYQQQNGNNLGRDEAQILQEASSNKDDINDQLTNAQKTVDTAYDNVSKAKEGTEARKIAEEELSKALANRSELEYKAEKAEKALANASDALARKMKKVDISSSVKSLKEYSDKLNKATKGSEEYEQALNGMAQELQDAFGGKFNTQIVADNKKLINDLINGSEKVRREAGAKLSMIGQETDFKSNLAQAMEGAGEAVQQEGTKIATNFDSMINGLSFKIDGTITTDSSQAINDVAALIGQMGDLQTAASVGGSFLKALLNSNIEFDASSMEQLQDILDLFVRFNNGDSSISEDDVKNAFSKLGDKELGLFASGTAIDVPAYPTTTKSGGGGGSSKSASDIGKEIQDKRLAVSQRKRDLLETKRADANPEDNAKYIKEEIDLLEEEQQILEEQIKSWKTLLKTKVQEYNAKHPELKITLDDNGEIANASELWGKVWAEYEKNMNEGMSKEELNEWFQELSDDLNGPMGIQENIDENVAAIAEKEKEQAELELEAITKAIDWKVKQIDYEIKRLNYYQEKLLKQAHGNKQTIEAMLEGFAYQEQEMLQLFDKGATLREGIDQLNDAKSRYPGQSQIFDEQILEYQSDLIDLNESILDLRNDIEDLVQNVMDAALDEIDKQIDRLDTYTSMLDHLNNIIDLSGRSMLDMGLKTQIGATKVQTMIGKMKTLKEQMDGLNKASKEAQAALDDRRADNDESSVKYWENQVEVIKQEAEKASDEFLASWEETLQAAQELFEMRVELAINTLSNALSPFETLEDFQNKYEKAKTINDQYLDDAERLYELNKLNRQLNLQLNDTNDLLAKQKLREIQQEINDLQADGVQMSQYDLDYLQKKYDLQLAEIALMEQQNSKKSMRLVRDAAGNWTYAYDADESKIEDATQKYEDAVHELDQLSKQYIDDVSEQLIQNQIEFKEALQDLDKNSADYSNQLLSLQEYYVERQRYLLDELNKGVENSGQTFHDTLYGQMTDLYDYNDAYMQFVDNSNLTIGELQTNYKDWQKVVEQAMKVAGTSWDNFGTDMGGSLDTLETHIQKLCDEIEELVNVLMGYISQSIGMVLDWEQKYSKRTDEEIAKNEQYIDGNFTSSGGVKKADYWGVDLSDIAMRMAGGETTIVDKNGNVWTNLDQVKTARQAKLNDMANNQQLKNNSNSEYWTMEEQDKIRKDKSQKWLDEQIGKIQGADTGAYTGDWSDGFSLDNGKLIKVHPKELILNKEDTSNILKTVDIVRGLSNWIDKQVDLMTNSSLSILNHLVDANIPTIDKEQNLNQQVQIEANFPNVTDHYEIEEALSNLSNDAAQYISANKNK